MQIYILFFSDRSLSFKGPSPSVLGGQEYYFSCVVKMAVHIEDMVLFYAKFASTALGSLSQEHGQCFLGSNTKDYSASCDNGTTKDLSELKIYTLKIKKVSLKDETTWWCELKRNRKRSNIFQLKVNGKSFTNINLAFKKEVNNKKKTNSKTILKLKRNQNKNIFRVCVCVCVCV